MKILITGGSGFIGTNFHEFVNNHYSNSSIINVDLVKPKINFGNSVWEKCDILHFDGLKEVFDKYRPDTVLHLAAETSCEPELELSDYDVNTKGSENLFAVADSTESVRTVIHTSTQFTNQFDFPLKDFLSYKPHTVYGESKIISEKLLLNHEYNFNWVIIRPTNVWGKWHLRYPYEFWKVLYNGKYIHPNDEKVIRSYGYVENICEQIVHFIKNSERLNREIFYVGDEPVKLYNWVNEFSLELKGRNVRIVPKSFVKALALFGDLLKLFGISFPITSSRFESMTTSNPAPMKKTFNEVGRPIISLEQGVKVTSDWLKNDIYG
ncbi:MAG: nucleoside-diphosphate-sugar epimerase [Cyclobacteriaceae bacterium]|jgi:nucleoside-diphosphate-sugar epimerase